jgi:hypothetical protein
VARSPEQVLPEVVRRVVAGGGSVLGLTRQERDLRSLYRQFVESPGTGGGNGQGGGHV